MPSTFAGSRARDAETQFAKVTIGAADIKTLNASPVELVRGHGAGTFVEFVSAQLILEAGSEVLAETADNLQIHYTDASGAQVSNTIECTGFIDQSVDTMTTVGPFTTEPIVARTAAADAPLVLYNPNDEFTGNASNDAKLHVRVVFRVHNFFQE